MATGANDEFFMRAALEQARLAAEAGEVPIGAVVVCEGEIVAAAHNRRELDEDPSAHAEFSAMVQASQKLGRWRLYGCTVYVTLEPCLMCAGLMVNARVDRCVYGAPDPKGGACGSLYRLQDDARLNHAFEVTGGVLQDECAHLLRDFFSRARTTSRADQKPACCGHVPTPHEQQAPAPHVLLAIDSFKGSATTEQIEAWTAAGIVHACPGAQVTCVPIADGGEGTMDAVRAARGGELQEVAVEGAIGAPVNASFLMLPPQPADDAATVAPAAVIELAQAAGIMQSGRTLADALAASTFGVGQLMRAAVDAGARELFIGLGGSATTDGGAGMLMALGARLLDAHGCPISRGLAGLRDLASIDLAPALETLQGVRITVLVDVDNPLVGARGAVRVFGPQKGLAPANAKDSAASTCDYDEYDSWMVRYARLLTEARDALDSTPLQVSAPGQRPRAIAGVPGAGAAGGTGAALVALGARLSSGIETVLDLAHFDALVARADLVITGEGNMDNQTAGGKAPVGVARRAKRAGVPVVAVVGGRADELEAVYKAGIDLVVPLCPRPLSLEQAMSPALVEKNAHVAGETAMRAYLM